MNQTSENKTLYKIFFKIVKSWPIFLATLIVFLVFTFTYFRYSSSYYQSMSKLEIIDKSMDNEMALPTAMTIFNRSMINLDNEIGVLESRSLHARNIRKLKSNIKFFSKGNFKNTEQTKEKWFDDYELKFKFDTDSVSRLTIYEIKFDEKSMMISKLDKDLNIIAEEKFDSFNTKYRQHNLDLEIHIKSKYLNYEESKLIYVVPIENEIDNVLTNNFKAIKTSRESDQLNLFYSHTNPKISELYLNSLMDVFDLDGVEDRQLEYVRTIEFVNSRSLILYDELSVIEDRKQNFKEDNDLSDIKVTADINISQKLNYDNDLFNAITQLDLLEILEKTVEKDNESKSLIPINIGIQNNEINSQIDNFNKLLIKRDRYLKTIGKKNIMISNIEDDLDQIKVNIINSILIYRDFLKSNIERIQLKESEFSETYNKIPLNEKILRSIERELQIKESLYLLLLQKKEEAAINLAVTKPSIKVIDFAETNYSNVKPNKQVGYIISIFLAFTLPIIFIILVDFFDTKIRVKSDIINYSELPIIAEIPRFDDIEKIKQALNAIESTRDLVVESVRMLVANLEFIMTKDKQQTFLITSSIKSEGKTLASFSLAKVMSADKTKKVLLIGSDLRNPQLHKFLDIDKNKLGLSDYIYRDDIDFKELIFKSDNLDILLSGTIPPNPTELLKSHKYKSLIDELKKDYDKIIVDSAPTLLVSDTLVNSKIFDNTIYLIRSGKTPKELIEYINKLDSDKKMNNIGLVLNDIGSSEAYGYSYAYKYGYNYGYGYGYEQD